MTLNGGYHCYFGWKAYEMSSSITRNLPIILFSVCHCLFHIFLNIFFLPTDASVKSEAVKHQSNYQKTLPAEAYCK